MEAKMNQFFESVTDLFSARDNIPWTTPDDVLGCEREVANAEREGSEDQVNDSILRLSRVLVHSRQPEHVQRGIAMLESSLTSTNSPLPDREKLYLLALGHYRSGDYRSSLHFIDQCLEIAPDWEKARSLKKNIEERITKDTVIGIGATAVGAVGAIAIGIVSVLARRG